MTIQYPEIFRKYRNAPGVKDAIPWNVSSPPYKKWCPNCGGIGALYLFCITGGPFDSPPMGKIKSGMLNMDGKEIEIDIMAHWENGHWFAGINQAGECPVCKGNGKNPEYVEQMAHKRELDVTHVLKRSAPVDDRVDYTDY